MRLPNHDDAMRIVKPQLYAYHMAVGCRDENTANSRSTPDVAICFWEFGRIARDHGFTPAVRREVSGVQNRLLHVHCAPADTGRTDRGYSRSDPGVPGAQQVL